MTVIAYLLEYTLNVVCQGNRSQCARVLGIRRTDFNRLLQRCREGSNSLRAIEAILNCFCRENLSLDEVLSGYITNGAVPSKRETARVVCEDVARLLYREMTEERQAADTKARVLRSAEGFMEQLCLAFCSDACRAHRGCDSECPCKRFSDFVNWIKEELEADRSGGKREGRRDSTDKIDVEE